VHRWAGQQGFIPVQGRLGGGAEQVAGGDLLIVRIKNCRFHLSLKKLLGVLEKIVVQGVFLAHHDNQAFLLPPAHPAAALPGGHDGAGITHHNADIQRADINAQLQGGGGHHPVELAAGQLLLDLPALLGQKTGPIGSELLLQLPQPLAGPQGNQLGDLARLGIDDSAQAAF
jgi:hypothetical protein